MIKADLINKISKELNIPKQEAETGVNMFFETIKEALLAGEEIEVGSFGSFRFRNRPPRSGRNPRTGDPVKVPPEESSLFQAEQAAQGTDQQVTWNISPLPGGALTSEHVQRNGLRFLPGRPGPTRDDASAFVLDAAGGRSSDEQISVPARPSHDRPVPPLGLALSAPPARSPEMDELLAGAACASTKSTTARRGSASWPEPGPGGRRRRHRSFSHARRSALDRRLEFHAHLRADEDRPRGSEDSACTAGPSSRRGRRSLPSNRMTPASRGEPMLKSMRENVSP